MPRKKAVKTEKLAPEARTEEAAPETLEQIAEPTVEPDDEPIGDSSIEAEDTVEEINEDVPLRPAPRKNMPRIKESHPSDRDAEGCGCYDSSFPKGKLPPPPILLARELEEHELPKPKQKKDRFDQAMETLDDYYEGVPMGAPNKED